MILLYSVIYYDTLRFYYNALDKLLILQYILWLSYTSPCTINRTLTIHIRNSHGQEIWQIVLKVLCRAMSETKKQSHSSQDLHEGYWFVLGL